MTTDQLTGRALTISMRFILPPEWLKAIKDEHSGGLALLRLQGQVDVAVRKSVREQLRKILADVGGDPWHYSVAEPFDYGSESAAGPVRDNVIPMEATHDE